MDIEALARELDAARMACAYNLAAATLLYALAAAEKLRCREYEAELEAAAAAEQSEGKG